MKRVLAAITALCMFFCSASVNAQTDTIKQCVDGAKNVIYIIGEGMGANLIQYTQWKYMSAYEELNMQKMAVTGLVSTYSADNGVSDDAAAGTQLATGSLTDNGCYGIGAELDEYRVYENLFEAAIRSGKKVGMISDASFEKGVSAAFLVHTRFEGNVKRQADSAELDYRKENSTTLAADINSAISALEGNEGFVLVVDATNIEDCAEANDALGAMAAVKALDDAVGSALEYARNDKNTLVIVTSEHETGAVTTTDLTGRSAGSDTITFNTTAETYTNVMLFAEGRGERHFNGYYHASEVCRKIAHIIGIENQKFYDVETIFENDEKEVQETETAVLFDCDFEKTIVGAKLMGNARVVTDSSIGSKVLKLDNTATSGSYLKFNDKLFDNVETMILEMDVKSDQEYDDNSSLFQMANKTNPTKYFYFKYEPLGQGIRYSLNPGSDWKSSGTKKLVGIGKDDFVHLKYVAEPTRHEVYIDNELFLTYETKGSIPMLGNGLYAYIGHSMFSNDKDYSGSIDNIRITCERTVTPSVSSDRRKSSVRVTLADSVTDENDLPEVIEGEAKNVIMLIGDGMGQNIAQLSQWHYNGAREMLAMQQMPYMGLLKTYSLNKGVTDSAAGGTALATGKKTENSFVASAYALEEYKTLMDYAIETGRGTAVISTTDITDATPAVYSAHAMERSEREAIAAGQVKSGIDIFMGGGGEYFTALKSEIEKNGYKYITDGSSMRALNGGEKVFAIFGESGDLLQSEEVSEREPLIGEMLGKTIEMLDAEGGSGFVVMAEGATIDHYAHSNYVRGAMEQTKLFDEAVRAAIDFARTDKNTLVVVTADHETGGLALTESASTIGATSASGKQEWTTGNHTSTYVPVYAYGPGAEYFTGVHDNTQILDLTLKAMNLTKSVRPDAAEVRRGLILDLDFDNEDIFGAYGAARVCGKVSYREGYKGKAVYFDGNADNYIELFSDKRGSLLYSGNEFTVSFWSKTDGTSNTNWLFYAAPGKGVQKYGDDVYIGIIDSGSSVKAERYLEGRAPAVTANITANEWKYVTLVVEEGRTTLYINGNMYGYIASENSVGDILELTPICYIGRANWESGEGAKGLVDEFKIYNYALTKEEITTLYKGGMLEGDERCVLTAEYVDTGISYTLTVKDGEAARKVYIALYDESGAMAEVRSFEDNNVQGVFENVKGSMYTVRAFVWNEALTDPVWKGEAEVIKGQ